MIDRRAFWSFPLLFVAAVVLTALFALNRSSRGAEDPSSITISFGAPPGAIRWIIAGGGPNPEFNQVQIEQDVLLARSIFADVGPGLTLFAGGRGSRAVQVLEPSRRADPLRATLAELFAPRAGRNARYRESKVPADGPATMHAILEALERALDAEGEPLTVLFIGHGEGGEEPAESHFLTWGPGALLVEDLAGFLDETPPRRPVRFVITSCYSGGFAELAFRGADPALGPAPDRCGLFATSWDRVASGCDPNPDRGAQEGYALHFLHALRGEDRNGRKLPPEELDLDGDGVISLLEAHTRARIASGSLDVPVTTSERYLRQLELTASGDGRGAPIEEEHVIRTLSARLGLERPEDARRELARLEREIERIAEELEEKSELRTEIEEELAAALLHRWPVLDDPWHPDFAPTLQNERPAITALLGRSPLLAARHALLAEEHEKAEEHDRLLVRTAPLERLVRALETVELASRLHAEGGPRWAHYQALLACERGRP